MSEAQSGILLPFPEPNTLVASRPPMDRARFEAVTTGLFQALKGASASRVGLWFDDTALFSCALLACWAAGAKVMVPPDLLKDTRAWVEAEADLWLTDTDVPESLLPLWQLSATNADEFAEDVSSLFQDRASHGRFLALPADAHLFLRTSGSSGTPKVIRKSYAQLQAEALTLIQLWSLKGLSATVLGSVSHQHMYGLTFRVMVPLHAGLVLDRQQARYPETLIEHTVSQDKCVWITSPALLQRLPDSTPWQLVQQRLARVVSAGGTLAETTRHALFEREWPLHEIYGSTETGVIATRHRQPAWTPLPGVALKTDCEDRLIATSPWTEGAEQTADVIELSQDGCFVLQGRADRILKLEDKRISLNRVEQAALSHAYVSDVHCAPSPLGGRLCAMAELSEAGVKALREQGRRHVTQTLSEHLRTDVDPLAVPRHWRFPETLPRNAQSKITMAQLRDCFLNPRRSPQWRLAEPQENPASEEARSLTSATTDAKVAPVEYALTGQVPLDLVYFSGHFPTFPLVPGVAQLGWALEQARALGLGGGQIQRIENLKFQHFLRPADPCAMTLKWDDEKRKLYFTVRTGANMTASGRIAFTGAI